MSKLQLVQDNTERPRGRILTSKVRERATTLQAELDRHWLRNGIPKGALEEMRVQNLFDFLSAHVNVRGLRCVDLGCGHGPLTTRLHAAGAEVLGVDLSGKALALFREQHGASIPVTQDLVPYTNLEDDHYDLVVATDLIAELDSREYPLFFSELYRLVKPDGWVFCSTPIDVYSVDALQRFQDLVERDFRVAAWTSRHHRLFIQLSHLPGIRRYASRLRNARSLITACEAISRTIWADTGVSHVAFVGKRKPLGS